MKTRITDLIESLSFRIAVASTAAFAVVIAVIVVVLASRVARTTVDDYQRREDEEAARLALVLSRSVHDLQRSLEVTGPQLSRDTLQREHELSRILEGEAVLRSLFSNVFVASADGRMLSYADQQGVRQLDFNLSGRGYFEQTVKERRAVISDPAPGRISGAPVIVLTYPLQDSQGLYGLLGGGLRLSSRDLLAGLVDARTADRSALTVVTDANGIVIAHPRRDMLLKSLVEEARLQGAFAAWRAGKGAPSSRELSVNQPGEVVSVATIEGANWLIWRTRSEDELLAPAWAARREAVAWAIALILTMASITFGLLVWLLRPLHLLTQRSQHIFDGRFAAHQGWPVASGEIGRLAAALQKASEEREHLESRNTELLRKLTSVMAASPTGIAFTRHQRFELVSREFCRQLGREESALLNAPARIIYADPADYATLGAQVGEAFRAGQPFTGVLRMVRGDGSIFWGRLSGNPVDPSEAASGTIWCLNDVTEEKAAQEELEWTATHDALTGLLNRRAFMTHAQRLVAGPLRELPAALLAVDLDHFKPINDSSGHAAGDAMLRAVASALQRSVRTADVVARLGGDEFAVLLDRCDEAAAMRVAHKTLTAISSISLDWQGRTLGVGASIGVALIHPGDESMSSWLERADAASYAAKAQGRGQVQLAPSRASETRGKPQ